MPNYATASDLDSDPHGSTLWETFWETFWIWIWICMLFSKVTYVNC